jgi:membrane fusion protein (multidrug efflux system)
MINTEKLSKHRVRIIAIAAIIFLILFCWRFIGGGSGNGANNYPATTVEVFQAKEQNIPILVSAFGSLRATEGAELSSEKPGIVSKVHFTEGQMVTKGTLLISLDDTTEQANLAKAKADESLYQLEFNRTETLYKKGVTPLQELDKASANLAQRKAQTQVAQAEEDEMHIVAPFDGQVGARKVSVGQYVSPGQALVPIVNRHSLKVEFSVPEVYLARLKEGLHVTLTSSAFPGREFTGVIDYVSPNINPSTRSVALEADVDNKDGALSPGLSVQVNLQLGMQENVLIVPEESLIATIEGQNVFVVRDKKAVTVAVDVGARADGKASITKGLKAGDIVVTQGQQKLRDGAPVTILETKKEEVNDTAAKASEVPQEVKKAPEAKAPEAKTDKPAPASEAAGSGAAK